MDNAVIAASFFIGVLALMACNRWLKHNEYQLIAITYWLYGIQVMSRRNSYRSIHRNAFISAKEVKAAERRVSRIARYWVAPLISLVPLVICLVVVR